MTTTTVVPAKSIRLSADVKRVVVPSPSGISEPRIELIREGDVVQAIEIQCQCGHHMRLICDYE